MRIFKTKYFSKWAASEGLADESLKQAVSELNQGLHDGALGSNVYKKRVGIAGKGKRGGARCIVAFKTAADTFFLYGYSKSDRETIDPKEELAFRKFAKDLFSFDQNKINQLLKSKELIEVTS